MFGKIKIRIKLIIYITLMLVVTMSIIGSVMFNESKQDISKRISEKLHIVNNIKIERIEHYFETIRNNMNQVTEGSRTDDDIIGRLIGAHETKDDSLITGLSDEMDQIAKPLANANNYHRIMVLSQQGDVIYTSMESNELKKNDRSLFSPENHFFNAARKKTSYSPLYQPEFFSRTDDYYISVLTPYQTDGTSSSGILVFEVPMKKLYEFVTDTTGLGKTGETILAEKSDNKAQLISPLRDPSKDFSNLSFPIGGEKAIPIQKSLTQENRGSMISVRDYNNELVDAVWGYIPELNWGICTKINHQESYASIDYLKGIVILLSLGIVFFSIIIVTIFVQRFLTPIINIRNNMVSLARGEFPAELESGNTGDEVYDTIDALNHLVERLKSSTYFAERLGRGDLNIKLPNKHAQDVLSKALLAMQSNLQKVEDDNAKRKWTTEGVAYHGEVLRKNTKNIYQLGSALITSLVKYLEIPYGAIYAINSVNENEDQTEELYYELAGHYANGGEDSIKAGFKPGQGLVGQCAAEQTTIYLNKVPEDYIKISSGLGESNPGCVLIVPLQLNDQVMGVVELAAFDDFERYKIEFVEQLSESIASAILAVRSTEQAKELLKDSQLITRELKKRENNLKKNQSKIISEQRSLQEKYEAAEQEIKKLKNDKDQLMLRLKEMYDQKK